VISESRNSECSNSAPRISRDRVKNEMKQCELSLRKINLLIALRMKSTYFPLFFVCFLFLYYQAAAVAFIVTAPTAALMYHGAVAELVCRLPHDLTTAFPLNEGKPHSCSLI
jgi:hypothetical protein